MVLCLRGEMAKSPNTIVSQNSDLNIDISLAQGPKRLDVCSSDSRVFF